MYYPSLASDNLVWSASFDQSFTRMQERLNDWYQTTRQSINLGEKIEFHELLYRCQVLRLNRPSPRCPNPTTEMRKKTLQASIALIKEFSVLDRIGKLFMLWHAAHFIIEAAICLLASVLTEMESAAQDRTHLGGEDVTILTKYIKTFPPLLKKLSRRWPNVEQHASSLDLISLSVLENLDNWSNGGMVWTSEFCALQQRLDQFSPFSAFPSGTQAVADDHHEMPRVELYPAVNGSILPGHSGTIFDSSGFQHATAGSASTNAGWVDPQPPVEHSSLIYEDSYGFNDGDVPSWDFSGIDFEEIFAALLDGGEPLMLNDVVGPS